MFVWAIYFSWRVWQNYELHSGFDFGKSFLGRLGLLHGLCARFHEFHHNRNQGYGVCLLGDYLMGTMDEFLIANPAPIRG
jgi:hypothetical protein